MSVARDFGSRRQRRLANVNRVSEAQAVEQARIEARMNALSGQFPFLADENPSVLFEMANSPYDDVEMMEATIDLVGTVGLQKMVALQATNSDADQVKAYNTMHPALKDAMVAAGWQVPQLKPDDQGLLRDILGGIGAGIGFGVEAGKVITKPVQWGLRAMNWLGEEASRPQRVLPIMDSQRRLMTETGMTPEQIMDLTGIDVSQASANGNLQSRIGGMTGLGDPLGFVQAPGDAWKALRTYWQIGHEGDDDYLATVQYEVYEQLEEEFPGLGKDALRWLKAHAAGVTFKEIAEDEGLSGDQIQPFLDQMGTLTSGKVGKAALARLESGRVSWGRTMVRALEGDWEADTTKGAAKFLSGSADAFYSMAMDPTLVAGKITKSTKMARWAVETTADLSRWQYLARVGEQVASKGEDAVDFAEAFKNVPGRGWKALRFGNNVDRLKAEMNAVYEPARYIQDALRTGDWSNASRRFPGLEPAIKDIQKFNAALTEAGEKSMVDDIGQVFEFYKHARYGESVLGTLADDTIAKALRTNSYKLFGHDGHGNFVVPHATFAQRQVLDARAGFGDWFWGRGDDASGLKALTDHAEEITRAADEADDVAVERAVWAERALSEDPAEAAAARAELDRLDEAAKAIDPADGMEIDPTTLGYVSKRGFSAREQVRRFATLVAKQAPERRHVLLDESADAPKSFRQFSDMVAFIKQEPRMVAERRYNDFLAASPAARHAMVQRMIVEMGDATGITETKAGREILRRHISKNNQAYGFNDMFEAKINGKLFKSNQAIFTNQTADAVSIPDFREMLIATREMNTWRWIAGGVRNSVAEAAMVKIWKPLTMFRMGFPMRAGADEALQFMGRVGSGNYFRERVLQRWAGIRELDGSLLRDVNGEVVAAPQAAFAPFRNFLHGISTIAGSTDEMMELRVMQKALENPAWMAADRLAREEILAAAKVAAIDELAPLPKALRHVEDIANSAVKFSSRTYQKLTRDSKFLSRSELAQRFLRESDDYALRVRAMRLYAQHPVVEHAYAQSFQHAFSQGASDLSAVEQLANQKVVMLRDPDVESGARAVVMNYGGDWAWVGHDDLGTWLHHYDNRLRHLVKNPAGQASVRASVDFVPQSVLDEITNEFAWAAPEDITGLDLIRHVRQRMEGDGFDEAEQAAVDMIMRQLQMASANDLDDLSFKSLPELVKAMDLPESLGTHPLLSQVFGSWSRLSPKARLIALRGDPDLLTTDMGLIKDRMFNRAYNEMRSIRESKSVSKMVQGTYIDGVPVASPPKPGHTRLYMPMVDRRAATDLVRLLSDRNEATRFAEALARQLRGKNLMGEAEPIWMALTPQRGYDLPTWMAGLKAQLIANGGTYIPGGLAGTSNYRLAEALRDTFDELLPGTTFRPTVGYIDHPDGLFSRQFGVVRDPKSKSVVSLDSYQTADITPLDRDNVQRLIHVEFKENGELVRRWMSPEQVDRITDFTVRAQGIKSKNVYRSRSFTRYDKEIGQLRVNSALIREDYKAGMAFLKGNGGTFRRTGSSWTWDDPDMAEAAERLQDVLDGMGLGDLDRTLDDLIGQTRMNRNVPVTFTDEMVGQGIYDDFVEIAAAAKRQKRRVIEEWVDPEVQIESRNARAALELLGIDVDQLSLSGVKYRRLIINRAKAHEVLRPIGGRPIAESREAIEQEMDALVYAWRESKLKLTSQMDERLKMLGPSSLNPSPAKAPTKGTSTALATRPKYDPQDAFADVLATMGGVSRRFDAKLGSWDAIVRRLRDLDPAMFDGATAEDLRKWSEGIDLDALSGQVRSQFADAEGGSMGGLIDLERQADGTFRRNVDHARLDALEETGAEISVNGGTYQIDDDLALFLLYYDQLDPATKAALEQALDDAGVNMGRTAREASSASTVPEPARPTKEAAPELPPYKMLGEIWTTGVTEEIAVRRAAQQAADEAMRWTFNAKTNEPMHELLYPLLDGEHATDNILRLATLDELPKGAFGPQPITGEESGYMQAVGRFYNGVADPAIASLARKPMTQFHFVQNMKSFEPIRQMLINGETDVAMRRALGYKLDNALRDVNELLYTNLKRGSQLDGDEVIIRYANAIWKAGNEEAIGAREARELYELLAEMELGRPRAGDFHKVLDETFDMTAGRIRDEVDIKKLHEWHLMHSNATEEQVHRAMTHAIEQVVPFVDNHKVRSMFQEFLGPVFLPFYYAEELFLRRFARGMYETPAMLRKGQLLMNGMRHAGVIRKDESTGNEYLIIPGSDLALETMASVAAIVTGNEALNVDIGPLSLRTEYVMPGWNTDQSRFSFGPLVGFVMEGMTRRFPEMAWNGRYSRGYWEYLVPGQIADGYKLFGSDREQIASAEMSAITMLEASGRGLPEGASPAATEQYLEDVRSVTRAIGGVRWATKQLFAGASPFDEQAKFRQEFAELLGQGVSYEQAVQIMIDQHGPNGVIYTIFGSENQTGAPLPSSETTYKFLADHGDLFEDNPTAMAWLLPQPKEGDKFDYRAFNESMVLGLRERRTPEEFINEIRLAQAAPEYYEYMGNRRSERRGLVARKAPREELDRFDAETKIWKDGYLIQHPMLAASFSAEASARRQGVLESLPALIDQGIGGDQAKALKPLLDLYTEYQISYSSYAGQTSNAAKALKKEIYDNFYTRAWKYVQEHPETNAFWSSVIEPELPENLADIEPTKVAANA